MLFAIALLSTLTAVHAKGVSIVPRSYAETAISGRSRVGRASSPRLLLEDPDLGPMPHHADNVGVLNTATDTVSLTSTIATSASSSPSSLTECNIFKLPEARKKSKLARVGAVGTATTWRTVKTCLGLGSLWLGGTHWAEITLYNGWSSCCTVEVPQAHILSAGICQSAPRSWACHASSGTRRRRCATR